MADDIYGFGERDIERISQALTEIEGVRLRQSPSIPARANGERIESYLGKATSDIAAMATTTTVLTTLNGAINNSVTSVVVTSTASMPTGVEFIITVDSEDMLVISISGTTLTVARAANGTSAASHLTGANVSQTLDVLGTGTADLCPLGLNADGTVSVDRTQGTSEAVYSPAQSVIASGSLIMVHREPYSGYLIARNAGLSSIIAHTAATFTIPAIAATTTVTVTSAVDTSIWMVVGQTVEIYDGSHQVYGYITAIADATHFTFKTTRVALGSAGNTMASQAQVIISGDPAGGGSSPPDWAVGVDGIMNNSAQSGNGEKTSVDNGSGGWKVIASSGSNHFAKLGFNGLIVDLDSGSPGVDYANHDYRTMSFFTSISAAIYSQTGILYQDSPGSGPTNSIKLEFNPFVSPASVTLRGAGFLNPATAAWSAIPTYVAGNTVYVIDATTGKRQGYTANATNTNDDPSLGSGNWDAAGYEPSFNIRDGAAVVHYGKTVVFPVAKLTGGGTDGSQTFVGGILMDYVLPT